MISFHTIGTIAKYEMRTLLRAWFFRIFAALTIFSLAIYNMAIFLEASGAPWIYRALPAALPYANLIILNLGQAIVAVFLASEFLKQDKKNDTVEVIYARSMTNSEYILGKAFGVLAVFFILNIIVLLVGIGFSFLSSDSSRGIAEYFLYPLLISLPTLVYIVGLSFLLMVTIKNQAVTFILLTGYIALCIFYLNNKFYNLPDFIAYNVPMMLSTISGFGQFGEMMMHRGIYLCLGISFIFFTVYRLARLPQSIKFQSFTLIVALFFLAFGGFLIYRFIEIKHNKAEMKQKMIEINNLYASYPIVKIDSCNIKLVHNEDKIFVETDLLLHNKTDKKIDTLILSLNPSLIVHSLKVGNSELSFFRKLQILKVTLSHPIRPEDKIWLSIKYSGKIDENIHFLEQDLKDPEENFIVQIYSFRKHYAWIKNDFLCLTSESLWYPVSGVGYSTTCPDRYLPDFINYVLEVNTDENLYALSQGVMKNPTKGKFIFKTENPIPQLSLLIGNYLKYSLLVDSVEYNLIVHKGNDYFKNHFNEVRDSLSYLIRELKNEYEAQIGFKYPFNRFSIAEVPAEFSLDKHPWSISSNAVQPEILFIPEKGIYLAESDFKRRKKREEDRMKRDNEEVLPEELQARIFKKFIRNNFMAEPDQYYEEDIIDQNTFSIFPEFFSFVYQLRSDKWPILNTALQAFIKNRNSDKNLADFWWRSEIGKAEQINMELKQNSLNQIITNGITKIKNVDGRITLNELILVKGEHLFSLFRSRYGNKIFDDVLDKFVQDHRFRSFDFSRMDSMIHQTFGNSIINDVDLWYNQIKLPGFLIKDLETYRTRENEFTKYQIRFKISNPEPVDGLITIFVEMEGEDKERRFDDNSKTNSDFSKKIYLPANSSKEIGLVFPAEPARMRIYTHISENLPNNLIYEFSSFEETRKSEAFDSIRDYSFFNTICIDNEYVVDNEDSNFSYSQSNDESYLKTFIKKAGGNSNGYKYSRIRSWNPPGTWKPVIESEFYGKYIRSAMYTKSGEGDRKAIWKGNIKTSGNYDVYCHIVKITNEWQRNKEKINYNFRVYHDEGIETISLFDEDIEDGWVYLGTFYITPGKAKVELNNSSVGNMVFADAVKWVKSK